MTAKRVPHFLNIQSLPSYLLWFCIIAEGRVQITKKLSASASLCPSGAKSGLQKGAAARKIKNRAKGNISLLFHLCALTHAKRNKTHRPSVRPADATPQHSLLCVCSVYLSGSQFSLSSASAAIIHTFVDAHTYTQILEAGAQHQVIKHFFLPCSACLENVYPARCNLSAAL